MNPEVIGYDDIGACARLRLHYSMETMTWLEWAFFISSNFNFDFYLQSTVHSIK